MLIDSFNIQSKSRLTLHPLAYLDNPQLIRVMFQADMYPQFWLRWNVMQFVFFCASHLDGSNVVVLIHS